MKHFPVGQGLYRAPCPPHHLAAEETESAVTGPRAPVTAEAETHMLFIRLPSSFYSGDKEGQDIAPKCFSPQTIHLAAHWWEECPSSGQVPLPPLPRPAPSPSILWLPCLSKKREREKKKNKPNSLQNSNPGCLYLILKALQHEHLYTYVTEEETGSRRLNHLTELTSTQRFGRSESSS